MLGEFHRFVLFLVVSELRTEYTATKYVLTYNSVLTFNSEMSKNFDGDEYSMFESSDSGVFGIGDEHCKKEKTLSIKIYMLRLHMISYIKYLFIPLSSNMYRQLVQYKNTLYDIFVIFLSAMIYMHVF